jgi:hypothetical protein
MKMAFIVKVSGIVFPSLGSFMMNCGCIYIQGVFVEPSHFSEHSVSNMPSGLSQNMLSIYVAKRIADCLKELDCMM